MDSILADVRQRGDAALIDYTERFDRFRPDPVAIPEAELEDAWAQMPTDLQDALELPIAASANSMYQRPADIAMEGPHGEQLGRRWRPVKRAGLYVPGDGRQLALMNAIPARVAGVQEIVICSPTAVMAR